jgi:hypothetical protein
MEKEKFSGFFERVLDFLFKFRFFIFLLFIFLSFVIFYSFLYFSLYKKNLPAESLKIELKEKDFKEIIEEIEQRSKKSKEDFPFEKLPF